MELLLLFGWLLCGVVIARHRAEAERPWAWAPVAAVFGPLWLGVHNELPEVVQAGATTR
jgi:hypothetical protein